MMSKEFSHLLVILFLMPVGVGLNAQDANRLESFREYNAALRLRYQHRYDAAISALKTIATKDPTFSGAYVDMIGIYESSGRLDEAEGYFQSLLKQDGQNAIPWYGLGWIAYLKKDYDRAIEYSKRCIQLNPRLFRCYDPLVHVYSFTDRKTGLDEAISYIKSIIQENPENPVSYLMLADLYDYSSYETLSSNRIHKKWEESLRAQAYFTALEKARKTHDLESEIGALYQIGQGYKNSYDYQKAIDFYVQALNGIITPRI